MTDEDEDDGKIFSMIPGLDHAEAIGKLRRPGVIPVVLGLKWDGTFYADSVPLGSDPATVAAYLHNIGGWLRLFSSARKKNPAVDALMREWRKINT